MMYEYIESITCEVATEPYGLSKVHLYLSEYFEKDEMWPVDWIRSPVSDEQIFYWNPMDNGQLAYCVLDTQSRHGGIEIDGRIWADRATADDPTPYIEGVTVGGLWSSRAGVFNHYMHEGGFGEEPWWGGKIYAIDVTAHPKGYVGIATAWQTHVIDDWIEAYGRRRHGLFGLVDPKFEWVEDERGERTYEPKASGEWTL